MTADEGQRSQNRWAHPTRGEGPGSMSRYSGLWPLLSFRGRIGPHSPENLPVCDVAQPRGPEQLPSSLCIAQGAGWTSCLPHRCRGHG